jgi:uncharacterized protein (DUF58 family)
VAGRGSAAVIDAALAAWRFITELRPRRGAPGVTSSATPGHGSDLHELRAYVRGDDVRHIDHAAWARTDAPVVRVRRAELWPGVDVLVDGTASMDLPDGHKGEVVRGLAAFIQRSVRLEGGRSRVVELGQEVLPLEDAAGLRLTGREPPRPGVVAEQARPGAVCLWLSDFLTSSPPGPVLRALAARAARLVVVRVLGPWEAAPRPGERLTLLDVETGHERTLLLSDEVVDRYRQRLARIRDELHTTCVATGATFVDVVAEHPLDRLLRDVLYPAGLVEPR